MASTRPFTLNKEIFNPKFYKLLQSIWFGGLPEGATAPNYEILKRWWMGSPEEKASFDTTCRTHFLSALESIGPEKYAIPSTPSPALAEPFLREISDAAKQSPENDGAEGASTALSFILLLDQMSRNIFRTPSTLTMVYNHYDIIAVSLITNLLSPNSSIQRPDQHPLYRLSSAHRFWFYMPLMHSESRESHKLLNNLLAEFRAELVDAGPAYKDALTYLDRAAGYEKTHGNIIEKFGRYPHRNEVLGRQTTEDERKWLEEGGETFGVAKS
ncbi:DUF924-domain-containing protein [Lepidopterella palustris CBS 459.81]|uniref:DUF924-domain-containing protein n=1 Tax=Lepidopterella palustris CBS 459.81 TaxID=1314670 RepID=A0A8E2EDM1_9PEZI|nr:DUF924-domain-containing protein [Lepidopterella palustris CBS 459.81]